MTPKFSFFEGSLDGFKVNYKRNEWEIL